MTTKRQIEEKKPIKKGIILIPDMFNSWFSDKGFIVEVIRSIIVQATKAAWHQEVVGSSVEITHPSEEDYGDYSSNIALVSASKLKMAPREAAQKLADQINEYIRENQKISKKSDSKLLEDAKKALDRVEVAGSGFLNFYLKEDFLITYLLQLLENKKVDTAIKRPLEGKKIAVEYTDPNPFKEFHLGHLYSNCIGEAISRLFEASGATLWRGDFYGDVGMHIAKSLYGFLANLKSQSSNLKAQKDNEFITELKKEIDRLNQLSLSARQRILGEGYALGVRAYEETPQRAEEIKDINYLVYIAAQELLQKKKRWQPIINYRQYFKGNIDRLSEIELVYEAGLRWSLEYFESIYQKLGTKFDGYYPESWVGEYGMKMVEMGLEKGVLDRSDGAVVFKGEKVGLHTRVFVNKLGLPTYEAKDLGLAFAKYQDFHYDLSINIFGKEIDEYYYVVKAALKQIDMELGKKAYHIAHGMVKLPEGKMSSRTGNVITFEWLVKEAKQRTLQIMKNVDLPGVEKQSVAEKVGLAAIRYALLKSSIGNDVIFDFDKSISFEGESGPYLMYTYARCRSVIRKSKINLQLTTYNLQLNSEELAVLRMLLRFEEIVFDAAKNLSPNLLCGYLFDLAQKYNLFYNKHTILGVDNNQQITDNKKQENQPTTHHPFTRRSFIEGGQPTTNFRLALTQAAALILQKGLYILGIETVERM